jgi:hypothetical protein
VPPAFTTTTVPPNHLAFTGSDSERVALIGLALMLAGGAILFFANGRRSRA